MATKLSRYCEGIIEAAWLAAVIVIPLFFNIYSSRIFEPDKITILRSLALLTLAAWLIKVIEEGGVRWEWIQPGKNKLKTILGIPFLAPVLILALVFLLATILSVTPQVSFWGSYQRLQGTYTTFSYLVIFAAVVGNLRRQVQVERLITVAILTSLPISLYGILQRYQIDPIPWGGDVIQRVAGNMGNSIFLAAYLIMVSPFTLIRIIESFRAILREQNGLGIHVSRATVYVFIGSLQLITLYFTGSRGPWLGWMAGVFFLFILLTLFWRKRGLMLSVMATGLAIGVFLILLNIPNGPLENLRSNPNLARLGHLLNAESDTGRVRVLIWTGASQLVSPHEPLEYPDGKKDPFNLVRPLIGYGPESMYVSYNRFYPPELGQLEKRNASPDRSHNETWDSLTITGVFGLIAYLTLFAFIFYYGLKWVGLIQSERQRNVFFGLYVVSGAIVAGALTAVRGVAYLGVGLPLGMIIGVIIYLVLSALFSKNETQNIPGGTPRAMTLIAIMAVVVAHFVEINFGIAIVATRTYFWTFSALFLVVGYILYNQSSAEKPSENSEAEREPESVRTEKSGDLMTGSKKKRRPERRSPVQSSYSGTKMAAWLRDALAGGVIVAIILSTLYYNYVSNPTAETTAFGVFSASLLRLRNSQQAVSYGVLALVLTSWVIASLGLAAESTKQSPTWPIWKMFAVILGVSGVLGLFFGLAHAGTLASLTEQTASTLDDVIRQVGTYEGLLTRYYIFLLLFILGAGIFLPAEWPQRQPTGLAGYLVALIGLLVVMTIASYTNLRIIQADVAFKMAETFAKPNQYPVAISIYRKAIELAPSEDYYYLFLGRGYIEYAKTLTDTAERDRLISQAEKDLLKAQSINPLNTDHTANLARLNSMWASYTDDTVLRQERAEESDKYFSRAVTLSPNNARLWDEWAILLLEVLSQPEDAYQYISKALAIDPTYDWTQVLLAQYFIRTSANAAEVDKASLLEKAAQAYEASLSLPNTLGDSARFNYNLALGSIYIQLNQPERAITAYEQAITLGPNDTNRWRVEEAIAQLYIQVGKSSQAVEHAGQALALAPDDQKDRLQIFLTQLQATP